MSKNAKEFHSMLSRKLTTPFSTATTECRSCSGREMDRILLVANEAKMNLKRTPQKKR